MNILNTSVVATIFTVASVLAPSLVSAQDLYRQLELGSRGADVSTLQSFLSEEGPTVYPSGLVTGYFGTLTRGGVKRFQINNGISPVGRVGPQTMAVINGQMGGSGSTYAEVAPGFTSPAYVNVNGSVATFTVNTDMPTRAVVYYSPSPIVAYEDDTASPITVTVGGEAVSANNNLQTNHSINSLTLLPNTTYYAMVVVKDKNGVVSLIKPTTFRAN